MIKIFIFFYKKICVTSGKYIYLLFSLPILCIVVETGYICIFREGRDFSWFSLSALAYITVLISVIWKQGNYKYKVHNLECYDEDENEKERKLLKKCFAVSKNILKAIS